MPTYNYSSNGVPPSSHVLGETFQCFWDCGQGLHCNALICGYDLSKHLREVHGIHGSDKTRVYCLWNSCNKDVNKECLTRHVEEIHMRIVYMCECHSTFSRKDTLNNHKKTCPSQH
ncbi:hypothetical protein BDR07DRAFT_1389317 [Suillus spraguei]|nr:hypothetical protein BDR07DRAFT_1438566 [Suillus spraguei]KAG2369011.1 hypothetical protein BDR07DRAFT_1389317 [Suillus spraguei]